MPKREKSSTKNPQNMRFLQKIPLKKSFKTISDFYIQHRNMTSRQMFSKFSTFFMKTCEKARQTR